LMMGKIAPMVSVQKYGSTSDITARNVN